MNATLDILKLIGLVLAFAVVGFVVLMAVRKRFLPDDPGAGGGFLTLHELRAMRDRGEIDAEEYEHLRQAALAGWSTRRDADSTEQTADNAC